MKRSVRDNFAALGISLVLAAAIGGCASGGALGGWTTLIDGNRGLDNFNRVGEANWSGTDGAVQLPRSAVR